MLDDIKKSLGELVFAFSQLEDSLTEGLAQIINIDYKDAKIIFSAISFGKKTQIINALLRKYYFNENELYIYKLLSKANELENRRNMYIHSDWEYFVKTGNDGNLDRILKRTKLKYKRKDSAEIITKKFSANELKELKEIVDELLECSLDLFGEFGQAGSDIESETLNE